MDPMGIYYILNSSASTGTNGFRDISTRKKTLHVLSNM